MKQAIEAQLDAATRKDWINSVNGLMWIGGRNIKLVEPRRQTIRDIVSANVHITAQYGELAKLQRAHEKRLTYQLPLVPRNEGQLDGKMRDCDPRVEEGMVDEFEALEKVSIWSGPKTEAHTQILPVTNPEAFPTERLQVVQSQHYPSSKITAMWVHRDTDGGVGQVTMDMQDGPVSHILINDARIVASFGFLYQDCDTIWFPTEKLRRDETFTITRLGPKPKSMDSFVVGELESGRHAYLHWLDHRATADPRTPPFAQEARLIASKLGRRAPDVWKEIDSYWQLEQGSGGRAHRLSQYPVRVKIVLNQHTMRLRSSTTTPPSPPIVTAPDSTAVSSEKTLEDRATTLQAEPSWGGLHGPPKAMGRIGECNTEAVQHPSPTSSTDTATTEELVAAASNQPNPKAWPALEQCWNKRNLPPEQYATYEDMISILIHQGLQSPALRTRVRMHQELESFLRRYPRAVSMHNMFARSCNKRNEGKHERFQLPVFDDVNAQLPSLHLVDVEWENQRRSFSAGIHAKEKTYSNTVRRQTNMNMAKTEATQEPTDNAGPRLLHFHQDVMARGSPMATSSEHSDPGVMIQGRAVKVNPEVRLSEERSAEAYLAWLHHRQQRFPTVAPNYPDAIIISKKLGIPAAQVLDDIVYRWLLETDGNQGEWYRNNRLKVLGEDPRFDEETMGKWEAWLKKGRHALGKKE
ncbi:hypothetical protein ACEQ8H_008460 [Pleosporales sp. CAS-2024a]